MDRANKLKAAFNLLWDKALEVNETTKRREVVSYRDITRMADIVRSEGPNILGLNSLPKQIDSGLSFSCAALDPNKARAKETLKQGIGGLSGAGGLALVWVCLGQLMNPGVWATVVAFFVGGIPGGPIPVVGIAVGLFIAIGAVWAAFQKMSPEEKAVKAHEYVMKGIDNWVEYGSSDVAASIKDGQNSVAASAEQHGFLVQELSAPLILIMNVANADGIYHEAEKEIVNLLFRELQLKVQPNLKEAIQTVNELNQDKRLKIVEWCFQVARADGIFHANEVETLRYYCKVLGVDFDANARNYGLAV